MLPSLSMVTKRVKSSVITTFFALFPRNLMQDKSSRLLEGPVFLLQFFSFKLMSCKEFSMVIGIIFSGDLNRWLTRSLDVSFEVLLKSPSLLFWMCEMFQKFIEPARLIRIMGPSFSSHGENWRLVMGALCDSRV